MGFGAVWESGIKSGSHTQKTITAEAQRAQRKTKTKAFKEHSPVRASEFLSEGVRIIGV